MSTQPVSQEFGAVNPRTLKPLSQVAGKVKKKRKMAKRASDLSKRAQVKSKAGLRKSPTKASRTHEPEVRHIENTNAPKETVLAESVATIDNPPEANENAPATYVSPEPVAGQRPDENDSLRVGAPAEDFSIVSNPAIEIHAANEAVDFAIGAAVETAELVQQVPTTTVAEMKAPATFYKPLISALCQFWSWLQNKFRSQQARKRLRVCETVSLGEKRFLAVIQVDGQEFLVGGSSTSVSTLAQLEPNRGFSDALRRSCEQGLSHA